MVENKQYWFRFNNFIDEISTVHFLISHLLSSLRAIMIFPGLTCFSSSLISGWFHPVLSIYGRDPPTNKNTWNTRVKHVSIGESHVSKTPWITGESVTGGTREIVGISGEQKHVKYSCLNTRE